MGLVEWFRRRWTPANGSSSPREDVERRAFSTSVAPSVGLHVSANDAPAAPRTRLDRPPSHSRIELSKDAEAGFKSVSLSLDCELTAEQLERVRSKPSETIERMAAVRVRRGKVPG